MPFDPDLAERLKSSMPFQMGLSEITLFGGFGFALNGNIVCSIHNDELILRVGVDKAEELLEIPHFRVMDLTKHVMSGWVIAEAEAIERDEKIKEYVDFALEFVSTLPKKDKDEDK